MASSITRRLRRRRHEAGGKNSEKGTTTVSVNKTSGSVTVSDESETSHPEASTKSTTPAYVRVAGGKTINLGDFESLRIDISVEMPCEPTSDAVEAKYYEITATLDKLMSERIGGKEEE